MDDDWFNDNTAGEEDDHNLNDSWETCNESGSSENRDDEISETTDEDVDSESNLDENAFLENFDELDDYEDDVMVEEILSRAFGGWQDSEYFDVYNEDSDPSDWTDDYSGSSWGQSDLWQPTSGCESTSDEEYLTYGKSINIVDLLRTRESGINSHLTKARRASSLLTFSLKTRWPLVSKTEMLIDTFVLIGRSLYPWEGCVLIFLHTNSMVKLASEERKTNALTQVSCESFIPVTFTDIITALVKSGVSLVDRDESGKDLLIEIVDRFEVHEDSADFIELLIKHGLDIEKNGDQALRTLCDSARANSISKARLRAIKLILGAGLKLSMITKRDLITKFSRNLLSLANETAVEIVKLLLSHGCYASEALLSMESQEYLFGLLEPKENFGFILEIAMILLENDALVNSPEDVWKPNFVFRMLDVAAKQPNHSSMLPLLKKCIYRGLDVQATSNSLKNVLMGFCEKYKHEDLPEIIRLLCSSGIDVNQVDKYCKSGLIYLSFNYPICRKSICDAVRTLLELNIDAKRTDPSGSNALLSFLASEPVVRCCKYSILKIFNESSYWETLDLLLDAGIDVNQTDSSGCCGLTSFLYNWSSHASYGYGICQDCLNSDFLLMFEEQAMESLGIDPFKPILRFVERLLEAGADTDMSSPLGSKSVLHHVCSCFEGDLLIALVSLLCKAGIDVNAKTTWFADKGRTEIDVIEVIKQVNPTQVHLIDRLIDIMKPYGFKVEV